MMIVHIDSRLRRWGHWVSKSNRVGFLGFPRQCAFMRLTPRQLGSRADADYNDDAEEMDIAFNVLRTRRADLALVVKLFYTEPGTVQDKAKQVGCCRDTLYARLNQAHIAIQEWLDDRYLYSDKKYFCRTA